MAAVVAITPAAAVPAMITQRATMPVALSAANAASVVSVMRGMASVRQEEAGEGHPDLKELGLSMLEPAWEAYKEGKFDDVIAAFKAGEFDDDLPSKEMVLTTLKQVFALIQKVVPTAFRLLDEVKAGKHDDFLEAAKDGTLEDFLLAVGNALFADVM
ncbi:hypothetical protein MMPV_004018 [Pyropia vietnamensis]